VKFDIFKGSLDTSRTTIAIQMVLLVISGLVNLALVWGLVSLATSGRTILLPPTVEKSFWVEKENVSASYLEQMAGYIAYLSLQSSPATVEYQNKVMLEYVAPSAYGRLKQEMDYYAEKLRKGNISQTFVPKAFEVNATRKSVVVGGVMTTYVNEKVVGQKDVSVLVGFEIVHGKLYVKSFKEVEAVARPGSDGRGAVAGDSGG
jgi:conjugal transfer pilus assembly protein TraE